MLLVACVCGVTLLVFFARGWLLDGRGGQALGEAMRRYLAGEFVRNHPAYGPDGKPWEWDA